MDVGKSWEPVEDGAEFLGEGLGGVLDFADVEGADAVDFEARADLGGQAALGAGEDDVEEFLGGRDGCDLFPCCLHLGGGPW